MKTIDGESHFCEVFLDGARVPVTQPGRRGERRLAGHQRDPALRAGHRLRPAHHHAALAAAPAGRAGLRRRRRHGWDDPGFRRHVGRLDARVDALWRMTQRCITEAEATGVPSPLGSAVKLGYSELGQEIAELGMRLLGRRALGAGGPDDRRGPGRARLPLVVPVHDRGGHLADPAQPHRRADPRHAEGPLTVPLDVRRRAARRRRRPRPRCCAGSTGLRARRSRATSPPSTRLIADLRAAPRRRSRRWCRPTRRPGSAPRPTATAGSTSTTPATSARTTRASPSTRSTVDGDRATGTVTFPIAYEGPPGIVHGGFLGAVLRLRRPAPQLRRRRRRQDHVARAPLPAARRRC